MVTRPPGTGPLTTPVAPDDLAETLSRGADRLGLFAGRVTWFAEVGSTNAVAARLAEGGAPEGTVIGADAQTAGRGRLGRTWSSPPGAGLYLSAILRPPDPVVPLVTLAAGVAVADGIGAATGLRVDLKWPNDVYVGTRKLAGILAEAGQSADGTTHVVLGVGLNLMPAAYPADVAVRATSLELELGRPVDRGLTLASCLTALSHRYRQLIAGGAVALLDDWRAYAAATFGRQVECRGSGAPVAGVATDIDASGALLVRTATGVIRVIAGEVLWR